MENVEKLKAKCLSLYEHINTMCQYTLDQLSDLTNCCEPNEIQYYGGIAKVCAIKMRSKLESYETDIAKLLEACKSKSSPAPSEMSSTSTILADVKDIKKECPKLMSLRRKVSVEEYTDDDLLEVSRVESITENNEKDENIKNNTPIDTKERSNSRNSNASSNNSDSTKCSTETVHKPNSQEENEHSTLLDMLKSLGTADDNSNSSALDNLSDLDTNSPNSYSKHDSSLLISPLSPFDSEGINYKYTDEDFCDIYGIKKCYVVVEDFTRASSNNNCKSRVLSEEEKEKREINRLTNMETLENPSTSSKKSTKPLKQFLQDSDENESVSMDMADDDSDATVLNEDNNCNADLGKDLSDLELPNPSFINDENDEMEEADHQKLGALGADYEETSSESEDEEINGKSNGKEKEKIKMRRKRKRSTSEERERKKWLQDPLLTTRLFSSEEEDEDVTLKSKNKQVENVMVDEKKDVFKIGADLDEEEESSSSKDKDNKSSATTDVVSLGSLDSESDCELIGTFPKTETRDKGRRNIRAIISKKELDENTQLAERQEKERIQRLNQQKRKVSQSLSQLEELNEPGLVLDVDDNGEPVIVVDGKLEKKLKHHQRCGVRFMWDSCYESVERLKTSQGTGCVLAHCMGLGKSLQAITLIHTLFKYKVTNTKHILIVCPLSTVQNWKSEFKIMLEDVPDSNFPIYSLSTRQSKQQKINEVSNWYAVGGVLLLGYEGFIAFVKECIEGKKDIDCIEYKALLDPGPDLIICDEGHLIRQKKSNRYKCLMKVKTKRKIILTGTPFQNNLEELYYMVNFVKPHILGTKSEFMNRFGNPIINGGYFDSTEEDIKLMQKRSHVLHTFLKETVQRYESTELIKYLPKKYDYTLLTSLHPLQIQLYNLYLNLLRLTAKDNYSGFLNDYTTLRMIWSHPRLLNQRHRVKSKENADVKINDNIQTVPNDWYRNQLPQNIDNLEYGPKLLIMRSIIEECEKVGDKVIIFANLLSNLNCIEHFLQTCGTSKCRSWKANVDYVRMDGSLTLETRHEYCNKFTNDYRVRVFLLSQRVGGVGLNFVSANRLILMDVHFNPAIDNQSVYRIYRFGQKKECYIYRFVAMGTMEETIYERSVTKASISARVVDVKQIERHFKREDLDQMYRLHPDNAPQPRPYPPVPKDTILGKILQKHPEIYKYHEYQSLLENQLHEQLDESEQKAAWEEFQAEQENARKQAENRLAAANQPVPNPLQTDFNVPMEQFLQYLNISSSKPSTTTSNYNATTSNKDQNILNVSTLNSIGKNNPTDTFTSNKEQNTNVGTSNENTNAKVNTQTSGAINKKSNKSNFRNDEQEILMVNDVSEVFQSKNDNVDQNSSTHNTTVIKSTNQHKTTFPKRRMSTPITQMGSVTVNLLNKPITSFSNSADGAVPSTSSAFHVRERSNHRRQSTQMDGVNWSNINRRGGSNDVIEID